MPRLEPNYVPTPAEILERSAIVRATWSDEELVRRSLHFAADPDVSYRAMTADTLTQRSWTPPTVESPPGFDPLALGWKA